MASVPAILKLAKDRYRNHANFRIGTLAAFWQETKMAEHTQHSGEDAPAGSMDISDHVKTWISFWNGLKWSAAGILVIAVMLAIFRTHNG